MGTFWSETDVEASSAKFVVVAVVVVVVALGISRSSVDSRSRARFFLATYNKAEIGHHFKMH